MIPDKHAAIPNFGLYGEAGERLQPSFVHVESISARSRQFDWVIKPHRHGKLLQLLLLEDGRANEVFLDERHYQLDGNWLIIIPPGTVHGFNFQSETCGSVLTAVSSLIRHDNPGLQHCCEELINQPRLLQLERSGVLFDQLKHYLTTIGQEIDNHELHYQQFTRWLVNMLLVTVSRYLRMPEAECVGGRNQQLLNHFRELLEQHYRQHWRVKEYAEALHTSTSSLNRFCHDALGISAKTIIQDRMLMEIKRRVIYTREPLDGIAYALGFKDPSYFSRFFKKLEGCSPSEYRREKNRETETV